MTEILTNEESVGWYGIILTGTFLLIAAWRLTAHLWGWHPGLFRATINGPRAEGWTMRRVFHLFLFCAMFFELLGYAEMVGMKLSTSDGTSPKVGYGFLEIFGRCLFEFGAFSIATVLWFLSIKSSRAGQGIGSASSNDHFYQNGLFTKFYCLPATMCVAFLIMFIHSTIVIVNLTSDDSETLEDWKYNSKTHKYHLVGEGVFWTLHGILVLFCAWLMYRRLLGLSSYQQLSVAQKTPILTRMLVTMLSCAICYIMRGIMIFLARASLNRDDEDYENGAKWWIAAMWVPTLFPSLLLLYTFRRIERGPSWIDGVDCETAELLPAPHPPALIWKQFRQAKNDSEEGMGSIASSFDYKEYNNNFDDDQRLLPADSSQSVAGGNRSINCVIEERSAITEIF